MARGLSAAAADEPIWEFPQKLEFLFEQHRYKVAHGGRGGSKSWGFARALLIQAWQSKLRVLCAREVQNSIRDSVHKLLADQIDLMGFGKFYDVTQTEIRGINGSEFVFTGLSNQTADSLKSYEGVDRCWVEEAHKVKRRSWDILIPTIRKAESEIWISLNPELESDETWQRFVVSPPDSAMVVEVNHADNPWFPDVLEQERQQFKRLVKEGKRSEDDYENIWEGKPKATVYGAIFAKELGNARRTNRVCEIAYDPKKLVHTAWDIGKGDPTAIWFYQQFAGEIAFIDYFEDRGEDITYYLELMSSKPYKYAVAHMPHDSKHDRIGMPKTIEQVVIDNGFRVQVVPVRSLVDQINEARLLMARARFDEKRCAAGLNALGHYRWGYNNVLDELKPTPVHDWASHGSSAFMAAAMSLKDEKPRTMRPLQYDSRGIV